jgi:hypothetical protein
MMVLSLASANDNVNYPDAIVARIEYERLVSAGRGRIQDPGIAAAWPDGQVMTPEQAIAYASKDDEHALR